MAKSGWEGFIALCFNVKKAEDLNELLSAMLTPEEKDDISKRYLIIKELLLKQKTQRKMAEDLQVSIAKITRGSNELKRMPSKLLELFKRHFNKCSLD